MENKKYSTSVVIKFLVCSLVGIFLFFVPITLNGKSTIPLDHIVNFVLKIPYFKEVYGTLVIIIGVFLPFYKKTWNKNTTSIIFSLLKLLALPFLFMVLFNNGPEFLMNKDVIPFIWNKIVIPVTTIVPVGSIFLSLIISYGLMEFVGVFMRPVMKPIWKTPGRSAIDAVASFVGSYSLALLITNRVYKEGKYTAKEAVIIATGFSTVSATFMVIVAKTLDLMDSWNLYFWLTVIVTFLVTAITARIYPIRNKSDAYFENQKGDVEKDIPKEKFKVAFNEGMEVCTNSGSILENVIINLKDGIMLAFNIGSSLLAIGTLGIVLANHTPIFDWIGYLIYPFTLVSGFEQPLLIAKALALGIAEMFLPAVLVTKLSFEVKMLVAITCVSEVLFFSASIPCMMATNIPISFKDYLIIWFERVVLSILVSIPLIYLVKVLMG